MQYDFPIPYFLSQIIILIGYIIFFFSRFRKEKKQILATDNISRCCFIIGYILLKSANGVEHTAYGIVRNIAGKHLIKKNSRIKTVVFCPMLVLLIVMYGMTYNGFSTIMFIISGAINLFATVFLKEQGIRTGTVLASICNIMAFLYISSYASIIGEVCCGIMGMTSIIKYYKKD